VESGCVGIFTSPRPSSGLTFDEEAPVKSLGPGKGTGSVVLVGDPGCGPRLCPLERIEEEPADVEAEIALLFEGDTSA
jgi:hypothetical protein